jgi:hypothetical protein
VNEEQATKLGVVENNWIENLQSQNRLVETIQINSIIQNLPSLKPRGLRTSRTAHPLEGWRCVFQGSWVLVGVAAVMGSILSPIHKSQHPSQCVAPSMAFAIMAALTTAVFVIVRLLPYPACHILEYFVIR